MQFTIIKAVAMFFLVMTSLKFVIELINGYIAKEDKKLGLYVVIIALCAAILSIL